MQMPVYERSAGNHVAERISVVAGGDEDEHYAALVAAGTGNWSVVEEPKEETKKVPAKRGPGRPKKTS